MQGPVTLESQYRSHTPYYAVYDARDRLVIVTTSYKLARLHFDLCVRGHTARTLFLLAKKGLGPAARYWQTLRIIV